MKIRELGIENFRKFRQPIRLTDFDDGLNVICGPNEAGKSTVLEALRAVLFERHASRSERIQSFRPLGDDVAPTVDLTFELAGDTWKVRKQFLQKSEVLLEGKGVRSSGDEAEDRLQALLGFARAGNRGSDDDSRGALGLLWVEQGSSFVLDAPGQAARRTLEDVLAGEVGAVTGGRRAITVTQAVEKSLGELLTATGRPTKQLAEAKQASEAAEAQAAATRQELQEFETVLERLDAKRGELRRLVRDLDDPEQVDRLKALEADIQRAKTVSETLKTTELVVRDASAIRESLEARLTARATLRATLEQAIGSFVKADAAAKELSADLETARAEEGGAAAALEAARQVSRAADQARRNALANHAEQTRRRALVAAFDRLHAAEAIAAELEAARAHVIASEMTEESADKLGELEHRLLEARAKAAAGAATLQLALQPAAPEARLNGHLVGQNHSATVTEPQVLELLGIGRITVEPAVGAHAAQAAVRASEQDLNAFLANVRAETAAEARESARERAQAEQAVESLETRLKESCPPDLVLGIETGLESLRGALAGERASNAVSPGEEVEPPDNVDARWDTAREAERAAEGRREAAIETLHKAEITEARLNGEVKRATLERTRLTEELNGELALLDDDALSDKLGEARTMEARAIASRAEAKRATEGLDEIALTRRHEGQITKIERMRDDRLNLVQDIAALAQQAKSLGGAGPASREATAVEIAEAARTAYTKLQEEAETLTLLDRVIKDAQQEASRRYLAPVTRRVSPYITRLLPNASVSFSEDYTPERLIRGGREEAAELLSKGTQEQLAVLTRIAFADLLIEKGKPASLVLDDALVFADDDRFETMLQILTEAAQRMQIIVLSCRTSAYRGLRAKRIVIG